MTLDELTPEDAERVRILTSELLDLAGEALGPLLSPVLYLSAA
ncbi:hypothetical protein [Kribbella sandramycini]|uniref:Uncharacterized protein n=1 Tax=Kribbella sandramycini TaxID=60450 RepID=A0A841S4Z8_9ACTN|nr:hypothetical protein [Kribbella sandramycini]MBB6564424.1 hypothetical protein [Kribbella sandramycini]